MVDFYRSGSGNAVCSFIENKLYRPYLPTNVDENVYKNTSICKKSKKKKVMKPLSILWSKKILKCYVFGFV